MGALTETEIFDRMRSSLRAAIGHCEYLAANSRRGPTYAALRTELRLIEGCCKQASTWRQDTRWLRFGFLMGEAHKRAGDWLRGYKINGARIKVADSQLNPLFLKLAENLRWIYKLCEDTRTKRTGRIGMILPVVQRAPIRTQGRPIQVLLPPSARPGRLIVPPGAMN